VVLNERGVGVIEVGDTAPFGVTKGLEVRLG
jgi:hypothetical protein